MAWPCCTRLGIKLFDLSIYPVDTLTLACECLTFHPPPDHFYRLAGVEGQEEKDILISHGSSGWLSVIKMDGPPVANTETKTIPPQTQSLSHTHTHTRWENT